MQKTITYHLFFTDYHSGQFSKGYRLLSAMQKRLRRHKINVNKYNSSDRARIRETLLYNQLVNKFGNKV